MSGVHGSGGNFVWIDFVFVHRLIPERPEQLWMHDGPSNAPKNWFGPSVSPRTVGGHGLGGLVNSAAVGERDVWRRAR